MIEDTMPRWGIGIVVADELHADTEVGEERIIEGGDGQSLFLTAHKDIGGAIVGARRQRQIEVVWHAEDDAANARLQRVTDEAAALCPQCLGPLCRSEASSRRCP
jgi:hypothetical protein